MHPVKPVTYLLTAFANEFKFEFLLYIYIAQKIC